MGVIPAKENPDFRFLPAFAGFPRFIDTAPLSRSDLLPPDPARHFPLEGKNRKVGTDNVFLESPCPIKAAAFHFVRLRVKILYFRIFGLTGTRFDSRFEEG